MPPSTIDFSAEFGGRDAADAVLPHFKALKAAACGIELEGFGFPKLSFILRVDGEVNQYGPSGPGHVEVDREGEYLSVDISLSLDDRRHVVDCISRAIVSSPQVMRAAMKGRSWEVNFQALDDGLRRLVERYQSAWNERAG